MLINSGTGSLAIILQEKKIAFLKKHTTRGDCLGAFKIGV